MAAGPEPTQTRTTFCRICTRFCGLIVDVEANRVVKTVGDRDHPATRGYTCPKGRHIGDLHDWSRRFLTAQRGNRAGQFTALGTSEAITEIAGRLTALIAEHGPDSVGLFLGTQAYQATPTIPLVGAWLRAVGTHKYFRTMTIDQSAKVVTAGRLGWWQAGPQRIEDADVWMLVGINPLVSMLGGAGGLRVHDGRRWIRRARERGLNLIVVDPRRTETAAEADRHLQLLPGTDALLMAALLQVILEDDLHDKEFCADHVCGMDDLRTGVSGASPKSVADVTGIEAAVIVEAAREFAMARSGMALTGTGPNMGPWSNLTEHLVQCLNVVCGRFPREGDPVHRNAVLAPAGRPQAQAISPARQWESGYRSRLGFGLLEGDLPTSSLPAEITEPGTDRLRALIVIGGNPVAAIPDQQAVVDAFGELELLVTVDPFPTETARLADYVIAPAMMLERADNTRGLDEWYEEAFAQYTPPILEPPDGAIEDWRFFADLAAAMGLTLRLGSLTMAPGDTDELSTDQLLDHLCRHGRVDLEDLRRHPHGRVYPELTRPVAAPAEPERGRFEVLPGDVAAELAAALSLQRIPVRSPGQAVLIVRRTLGVMNTVGRRIPGCLPDTYNPCHASPGMLADLGVKSGALVEITSAAGRIVAVAQADDTQLPGVVSMSHCFGDLPGLDDDPTAFGANPNRLLSLTEDVEDINAMPRISAVPVTVRPVAAAP